mmetsp:Transcript_45618/g.113312  ORF Transcript_45618/g.113312 Transcript_45618/m.113312 type:complete len:141 (+) Transcript_45618:277-699(+)
MGKPTGGLGMGIYDRVASPPASSFALRGGYGQQTQTQTEGIRGVSGPPGPSGYSMPLYYTKDTAPGPSYVSSGEWQYRPVQRPVLGAQTSPAVETEGGGRYGPAYAVPWQARSNADKSPVKYAGFLPLEGPYQDDSCRIG